MQMWILGMQLLIGSQESTDFVADVFIMNLTPLTLLLLLLSLNVFLTLHMSGHFL